MSALRDGLDALIERRTRPVATYAAFWPATVVAQAADGLLELQPDSDAVPGVTGVPIRVGIAGAKLEVPRGARCLLGWEGADPQRPYVAAWVDGTMPGASRIAIASGPAGNVAAEHVITTEAVTNIVLQVVKLIPGMSTPGTAETAVATLLEAASQTALDPVTGSAIIAALTHAFEAASAKPPAVAGVQLQPGIGCAGLIVG